MPYLSYYIPLDILSTELHSLGLSFHSSLLSPFSSPSLPIFLSSSLYLFMFLPLLLSSSPHNVEDFFLFPGTSHPLW